MKWIALTEIVILIHSCTYATGDDYLTIGGTNSPCDRTFELLEDTSYTVVFDGKTFPHECNLLFKLGNKTIKDGDQRYKLCVDKESYNVKDRTLEVWCYLYTDGTWALKYGCYSTVNKKNGGDKHDQTCADIGHNISMTFTNIYGLDNITSQEFQSSYIKLKVHASWNMPVWMIVVIIVSSLVALGIGILVVVMIFVRVVNKHHRERRARIAAAANTYQWRIDGTRPNHLATGQYATKYGSDMQYNQSYQNQMYQNQVYQNQGYQNQDYQNRAF